MANRPESLRKKGICIQCEEYKPIKTVDLCQNCHHKNKRKTNVRFFLGTRYTEIKQRCENKNNATYERYKNRKLEISREEFIEMFIECPNFKRLMKNWAKHDFDYKYSPSVDRIDTNKGYIRGNIQFITHSENSKKDQKRKPVKAFKNGILVGNFPSQYHAARELSLFQANIFKVLMKQRKHTGGFYFEYA